MKKKMKGLVLLLVLALSVGTLYGQTVAYTEQVFIKALVESGQVKTAALSGSDIPLTRERAAVLIVKYLGYEALAKKQNNTFKDVTTSVGEINLVSQLGIMGGTGNGLFSPQGKVSAEQGKAIIQKLSGKLNSPITWNHACYAISSSSQMDWIKGYQAVSFGWAQLEKDATGQFVVATNNAGYDFKVPAGFEKPLDLARTNGVEAYLMVYFENKGELAKSFLEDKVQKEKVINELVGLSQGLTKDGVTRDFDGITIDFEHFKSSDLKLPYNDFLQELKAALKQAGKKLNVAVQPTLYFKGYDYKGIGQVVDHVILMAHDYGASTLTETEKQSGMTMTPLTPIDQIYSALAEATTAITDKSKIALQFSFASLQWQAKDGKVLNSKAYVPSYDKIAARLSLSGTTKHFDNYYQSTYATYMDNGISNTIWYEDYASIKAKMNLAKLMGITSTSYWRLGIIPNALKPSL